MEVDGPQISCVEQRCLFVVAPFTTSYNQEKGRLARRCSHPLELLRGVRAEVRQQQQWKGSIVVKADPCSPLEFCHRLHLPWSRGRVNGGGGNGSINGVLVETAYVTGTRKRTSDFVRASVDVFMSGPNVDRLWLVCFGPSWSKFGPSPARGIG